MSEEKNRIIETQEDLPVNRYYVKLLTKEIFFFRRTLHDKKELGPEQQYTYKTNVKILAALANKYKSMFRSEAVKAN